MNVLTKIFMIFIMTFSGSMGAYFLKRGTGKLQKMSVLTMLRTWELYIGGILYVLGAVTNILLLRRMPYTVVYPMTALTYVWTMFVSAFLLKEKISSQKIAAVCFIAVGIFMIT